MAEHTLERIYTIPLRSEWMKVPRYKRARKGVVALKEFIAKHMKVQHRNVDLVKLDTHLNNEMWFRGGKNSPVRITVKAVKKGEEVHVGFVEVPEHVKFAQTKHARFHVKARTKAESKPTDAPVQTEEEKKVENEKEQSVAIANQKRAEQQANASKHTTKARTPEIKRMALKK